MTKTATRDAKRFSVAIYVPDERVSGRRLAHPATADPIVADCDCLTPASLAVAAYLAWFDKKESDV